MADRYGRGQKDRFVQIERRAGKRQFFTSENRLSRADQR